jgi:hypothetical protein
MGPFQTQRGMSEIRHSEQVANSRIKREKINGYPVSVICGCSNCCGFSYIKEHVPPPKKVEKEKPKPSGIKEYREWMRLHAR